MNSSYRGVGLIAKTTRRVGWTVWGNPPMKHFVLLATLPSRVFHVAGVRADSIRIGVTPFTGFMFARECVHAAHDLSPSPSHERVTTAIEIWLSRFRAMFDEIEAILPGALLRFPGSAASDLVRAAHMRLRVIGRYAIIAVGGGGTFHLNGVVVRRQCRKLNSSLTFTCGSSVIRMVSDVCNSLLSSDKGVK